MPPPATGAAAAAASTEGQITRRPLLRCFAPLFLFLLPRVTLCSFVLLFLELRSSPSCDFSTKRGNQSARESKAQPPLSPLHKNTYISHVSTTTNIAHAYIYIYTSKHTQRPTSTRAATTQATKQTKKGRKNNKRRKLKSR
jgi:hypothetical protein